ncbi:MAG: hypothetical protein V3U76_04755 [Granulosicoccus sp.]
MHVNNIIGNSILLGLIVGASGAFAGTPTLAWESGIEFKQPESAIHDVKNNVIYVSNINGEGMDKDGNGFISKMLLDGSITELEWVTGLDAPKGMALVGDNLYVSDITALVEIDIASGKVINRYEAEGAKFMNDVAADQSGIIYVTDMVTNTIHKLADGALSAWVNDEALENPNGLFVEDGRLVVGAWGTMTDGFSTEVPGHLKTVSLTDGSIDSLGDGSAIGNLDGVEPDGNGSYYVTDWMAGELLHVSPSGTSETLVKLEQGSADLEVIAEEGLVVIPMMMNNKVVAYKIAQ